MIHTTRVWRIVTPFVFLLLLLPGCISVSSSPSSRFYALQPMKETGGAALPDAGGLDNAIVGTGPVTLPEYYNRPQIVTNNSDDTVIFAQFDRWAEPLNKAMARVIARNFSIVLPKINTEVFPWNSAIPVKYQVIMEVIQLDCRLDAEVVLCVQWSILDAQEKKMLLSKRSEYRKTVGKGNYAGLAGAISAICESLSRDIAQALTGLEKQAPAGLL
jgi:uncharacterized lipoprotein YmbA